MDYQAWADRHTRRRRDKSEAAEENEEHVAPSEPLEVQEHHASTTIVERIRDAIRNRMKNE